MLQHPKTDVNKPDKNGYSALIWAADLNQPDIVKILLQQPGIEVEEKVKVENGKLKKSENSGECGGRGWAHCLDLGGGQGQRGGGQPSAQPPQYRPKPSGNIKDRRSFREYVEPRRHQNYKFDINIIVRTLRG